MNLLQKFCWLLLIQLAVCGGTTANETPSPLKAGLAPEAAAANMTVPDGFRVQLAAGEPQVHQPIALAIDHRGRLWVAEAHTYPIRAPEGEGKDKIIILEDTDGDGTLDSRKVFIEGLNLVSGLEVGFGGVWVGAAPYLLFIPDKDGDDKPDGDPQVLLDGFGYQDTHETLNSFIWGPDGWLYGCHGVFTHSRVGKPGTPDEKRTPVNAAVWRYHPTRHEFDVFAQGTSNPWGVDFDDNGQAFITACVIPHLFHVIQGARYHRQGGQHFNPHTYDDIKTIADHAHYVGNIRDHAWWGHEPTVPHDTSLAGGGHAHCGAMIYLGDNWPDQHRNQIFFNNVHGNRVNNDLLVRRGSGFVGQHGKDLLLANDAWFRGINLRYGPDGSVYLIDWYDKNACHRHTPEIWDRTNGRVYRISYGEPKAAQVDLSKLSDAELVKLPLHKNDWYVRTARRILQERFAADVPAERKQTVSDQLNRILNTHEDPTRQLRALWCLYAIGQLSSVDSLELLSSKHEYVRAWTIQLLAEPGTMKAADLADLLVMMAIRDDSRVVRLYIASALQKLPLSDRWTTASLLLNNAKDADDHNLPLMYWYAIEPLVPADPRMAMQLARKSEIPLITRFIIRRASADNESLQKVIESLTAAPDAEYQKLILDEMLRAFEGRVDIPMPDSWSTAYAQLARSDDDVIRQQADQIAILLGDKRIFPKMRERLLDKKQTSEVRLKAMEFLVRGRDANAVVALQAVLTEPDIRGAAIRALAAYDDKHTPTFILSQYASFNESDRRDAIGTLVSRPSYAQALLGAIDDKKIPRTDLHAFHIRQLSRFEDEKLNARITEVWGEVRESSADKQALIASYTEMLAPAKMKNADASNGRRIYAKNCAACHVLFGEGGKVGPELTGSNRANLEYILHNILDPSAVLAKDYRMSVIVTTDGRVISGLVQKETDSALTVRTINDTVVVAKADIDEQKLSDLSLMPDRLLDQLQPEETRDLIAYLASPAQVALRGPPAPIDPKTNQVAGAIEGEKMKILAKSAGDAKPQAMDIFKADRWSGAEQVWWTGAQVGAQLDLELPVAEAGDYVPEIVMTKARDYGVVQLSIDGQVLGEPIDLYNDPDVINTGVLTFESLTLKAGQRKLSIKIIGANPKAVKLFMFGLDYIRLQPVTK